MTDDTRNARWSLDNWNVTANWIKTYAAGRRCCHDGCKTILSRYNGGETCDVHNAADDDLSDRLIFGEKLCPACGEVKPRNAEHFHVNMSMADGLSLKCKPCRLAHQRETRVVDNAAAARRSRERYANDPEFRERRKATSRENKARRYAADPEYRERCKATARASKARCKARGNS